jgi:predicted anti-sigma-YlaC factor YlaD
MKCDDIRELMPDLAAGLDASTPETNEHLRTCENCARTLEEFRQTMALLDEWQVPEPSPYFDTRLNALLREEAQQVHVGWMQWFRKPVLAISFAVVMLASVTVLRFGAPDKPKTEVVNVTPGPGTAVGDLQALEKNHDLYSDFDVLDDLQVQQDVTANP